MNPTVDRTPSLPQRSSFGEDFMWGTGTSSYQFEGGARIGGRGPSIWDTFTLNYPGRMDDGSNGNTAVDFYHKYKEDLKIAKDMGFNAFRISISWSRILPKGKLSGGKNEEGIKFYNDLIDELLLNGLTPFVALFHWDLPQALESEYKGFLSTEIVRDFCDYAKLCFWTFGDRVKNWITLNEPWSYSSGGYANGGLAPGRGWVPETRKDPFRQDITVGIRTHRIYTNEEPSDDVSMDKGNPGTEPYIVAHNLLLAHAAAVQIYREKFQGAQKGQIGIIVNLNWFEPFDPDLKADQDAANRARDFMFGWFMDPLMNGKYPESMQNNVKDRLPGFEDPHNVQGSFDFIGINYYTANYVSTSKITPPNKFHYDTDQDLETTRYKDGVPIGPKSGSVWLCSYPKGIKEILEWIAEKYMKGSKKDLVIYITKNGTSELDDVNKTIDDACKDERRIAYHCGHLTYLNQGIQAVKSKGIKVKGYFAWSFMDNFEWPNGYTARFGLIYVDFKDGYLARYPKDSATWFMSFLKGDANKITLNK